MGLYIVWKVYKKQIYIGVCMYMCQYVLKNVCKQILNLILVSNKCKSLVQLFCTFSFTEAFHYIVHEKQPDCLCVHTEEESHLIRHMWVCLFDLVTHKYSNIHTFY